MRIAFASNDGILLADSHFGDAKYFYIYEINGKEYIFVEKEKTLRKKSLNMIMRKGHKA